MRSGLRLDGAGPTEGFATQDAALWPIAFWQRRAMQIAKDRLRPLDALRQGVRRWFAWIVALFRGAVRGVAAYEAEIGVIDDHLIGNGFENRLQLIAALAEITFQPLLRRHVTMDRDGADD